MRKNWVYWFQWLFIIASVLLLTGCVTLIGEKHYEKIEFIAHRGFGRQYVENTIHALVSSLEDGADAVEFDISVSADGTFYLFHDREVDALTDGTGTFTELRDEYIESLRYTQADGTPLEGIGIPTLDEALSALSTKDCFIYPEIKQVRGDEDIRAITDMLKAYGFENSSNIISFRFSDFEIIRKYMPDVPISYLIGFMGVPHFQRLKEEIDQMSSYENASVLLHYIHIVGQPGIVEYARKSEVGIGAWPVNRRCVFFHLVQLGVYTIITSHSDFLPGN